MEEIINKIFKEKYPKGLSAKYTKEEMVGYMMAINDIKEQLRIGGVSQQRELLLAYHKHLDSFNDPTIYNASESMIDDYLANNCG